MSDAAYEVEKLNSYSVQIECIAVYDDYLVVGNCLGHILWYITSPGLKLLNANKMFSKKPIVQLAAVSGLQVIICLSAERGVSVLEFVMSGEKLFRCNVTDLPCTKGANCFALDVKTFAVGTYGNKSDLKGVRLCVAVKKQLNLYFLNGKTFLQFLSISTKLDAPRTLIWCDKSIVVGCKNEYFLVNIDTKLVSPLILTGISLEPIIVKISDTTFGLVKDSQLIVMSTAADNTNGEQIIELDDTPYSVAFDAPYLLIGFDNELRVQTAEPCDDNCVFRQEITTNLKILKMSVSKNGSIYAMSAMNIWCLRPVQLGVQIERLLEEKRFQLALKLASKFDGNDKVKNETQIRKLYARDLFEKQKYRDSIKVFSELNIDPHYVIGLFSSFLPQGGIDHRKETADQKTEMKIDTLIEYLTEVRWNVPKRLFINEDGSKTSCGQDELLKTIDNTLLKCYLQTNDALIAPIIRLNHCGLSETETTLKNYKKYNELIILYQVKGMHRKALDFLKQQSGDSTSIFYGPEKIIHYLQNMHSKDMDMVLEYSDWVLDNFPERGLKIFATDLGEAEQWPRRRVFDHLARRHGDLCVPYLEHVIHVWNDTDGTFHDTLIRRYAELLRRHDRHSRTSSSETDRRRQVAPPSNTKRKLLAFLERSDHYSLERTLEQFPICDECFEERITMLEKLGHHIQVLSIYIYKMNDVNSAIKYCDKVYTSKDKNSDRVYVNLLRLLNHPPDSWLADLGRVPRLAPDPETTIEILNRYAAVICPADALAAICDDVPVHRIRQYLVAALTAAVGDRRRYQLSRGLLSSARLQMQEQSVLYESRKVVLTKRRRCGICEKLFGGNSAFVKCLDGSVAHLSCYDAVERRSK